MSDLVLYKDKRLTMPFAIEDIGDVEAGDVKSIEGYLANKTQYDIVRITYQTMDPDVEVVGIPEMLGHRSNQRVIIRYSPSEIRQEALNTFITFSGKKRIPPE